jgi:hypothetical protein
VPGGRGVVCGEAANAALYDQALERGVEDKTEQKKIKYWKDLNQALPTNWTLLFTGTTITRHTSTSPGNSLTTPNGATSTTHDNDRTNYRQRHCHGRVRQESLLVLEEAKDHPPR